MRSILATYSPKRYFKLILPMGGLAICVYAAAVLCEFDLGALTFGIVDGFSRLTIFFPPDWTVTMTMLNQSAITVLISMLATPIAVIISLGIAIAAASNVSNKILRPFARVALGLERALPEIIVLIMLVKALDIGLFPAVVAIAIGSVGMLGKLLADAIEEVEERRLEALKASGASYWQVIRYTVIPDVLPSLIANSIFRFEVNIRAATVLGGVAGVGIGYELIRAIAVVDYQRATVAIILIMALVNLSERVSNFAREKILTKERL